VVRERLTRYLEAPETLCGLVKYLLELGLPSPRGRTRGSAASVRGILTNPAYTGQVYSGRKRMRPARTRRSATHPIGNPAQGWAPIAPEAWQLVATIPATVNPEHFAQVQAKLALNQQWASRNHTTHASWLRALVSCGVCQACCMTRTTNGRLRYDGCRRKWRPAMLSMDNHVVPGTSRLSSLKPWYGKISARCCDILAHGVRIGAPPWWTLAPQAYRP
jgi:site-specific DNA recombinase